jgi:hypothetical protein
MDGVIQITTRLVVRGDDERALWAGAEILRHRSEPVGGLWNLDNQPALIQVSDSAIDVPTRYPFNDRPVGRIFLPMIIVNLPVSKPFSISCS